MYSQCRHVLLTWYVMCIVQGRSKRYGWSGHGRTNNRAGKFNLIFLIFLNVLLYFLAGIIIEPGFFSILFLKQRRHSRQNVHSDDSILGRFRPSHAGSHHHSMGGNGPQVHEFVGLYSDPQCDAGTINAVATYMCCSDWTYLWTSFADSATSFADSATSFADNATMELATWVDRERVLLSAYRS